VCVCVYTLACVVVLARCLLTLLYHVCMMAAQYC